MEVTKDQDTIVLPENVIQDLEFVKEAIRENLVCWSYKDEQVLYQAYLKLEKLLQKEPSTEVV